MASDSSSDPLLKLPLPQQILIRPLAETTVGTETEATIAAVTPQKSEALTPEQVSPDKQTEAAKAVLGSPWNESSATAEIDGDEAAPEEVNPEPTTTDGQEKAVSSETNKAPITIPN